MPQTSFPYQGSSNERALVLDLLNKNLQYEFADNTIWKKLMGAKGEYAPILHVNDFNQSNGDTVKLPFLPQLDGAGKAGDTALEGQEEALRYSYTTCYINQRRHAAAEGGRMSQQRAPFDVLSDIKKIEQVWADQKFEDDIFATVYFGYPDHIMGATANDCPYIGAGGAIPPRYWDCADEGNNTATYSSTAATHVTNIQTAEGTLANVDTDKFTPNILEGTGVKLRTQLAQPINFNGYYGFVGVIHPYQTAQLRKNATWWDANINAAPRDAMDNPVFAGLKGGFIVGMWNNILLIESTKVGAGNPSRSFSAPVITSGSSNGANVRRAIFMGAGAVGVAQRSGTPALEMKNDFDYNSYTGVEIYNIYGAVRGQYTTDDGKSTIYSQNLRVVSTYSPAVTI